MVGIDDNVRVAPGGDDARNEEQSRPLALDPVSAKGLGDRHVIEIVPTRMGEGIERFARDVVRGDGLDKSRGAWRRPAIGVDENLNETDGETGPGVDRRHPRRVPALTEQSGALAGPNAVGAGRNAP